MQTRTTGRQQVHVVLQTVQQTGVAVVSTTAAVLTAGLQTSSRLDLVLPWRQLVQTGFSAGAGQQQQQQQPLQHASGAGRLCSELSFGPAVPAAPTAAKGPAGAFTAAAGGNCRHQNPAAGLYNMPTGSPPAEPSAGGSSGTGSKPAEQGAPAAAALAGLAAALAGLTQLLSEQQGDNSTQLQAPGAARLSDVTLQLGADGSAAASSARAVAVEGATAAATAGRESLAAPAPAPERALHTAAPPPSDGNPGAAPAAGEPHQAATDQGIGLQLPPAAILPLPNEGPAEHLPAAAAGPELQGGEVSWREKQLQLQAQLDACRQAGNIAAEQHNGLAWLDAASQMLQLLAKQGQLNLELLEPLPVTEAIEQHMLRLALKARETNQAAVAASNTAEGAAVKKKCNTKMHQLRWSMRLLYAAVRLMCLAPSLQAQALMSSCLLEEVPAGPAGPAGSVLDQLLHCVPAEAHVKAHMLWRWQQHVAAGTGAASAAGAAAGQADAGIPGAAEHEVSSSAAAADMDIGPPHSMESAGTAAAAAAGAAAAGDATDPAAEAAAGSQLDAAGAVLPRGDSLECGRQLVQEFCCNDLTKLSQYGVDIMAAVCSKAQQHAAAAIAQSLTAGAGGLQATLPAGCANAAAAAAGGDGESPAGAGKVTDTEMAAACPSICTCYVEALATLLHTAQVVESSPGFHPEEDEQLAAAFLDLQECAEQACSGAGAAAVGPALQEQLENARQLLSSITAKHPPEGAAAGM